MSGIYSRNIHLYSSVNIIVDQDLNVVVLARPGGEEQFINVYRCPRMSPSAMEPNGTR